MRVPIERRSLDHLNERENNLIDELNLLKFAILLKMLAKQGIKIHTERAEKKEEK